VKTVEPQLLLLNKPFQVLTQFTTSDERATLRQCVSAPGFYPAGRLDYDSEGLVLLTNSPALQTQLSDPRWKVGKTYFVQVEGEVAETSIEPLRRGVKLSDGITLPAQAVLIAPPPWLWPREPPIRFRKAIPTSWLSLTLREGRNRQVRRMTAAIGHPTLRLIRWSVGDWTLQDLRPGESRDVGNEEIVRFMQDRFAVRAPTMKPRARRAPRRSRAR
jgi:23S rRNA pseudouridine2457 synthase